MQPLRKGVPRLSSMSRRTNEHSTMSQQRNYRNIALIGFMGAGKTCVGRLVAAKLRFQFMDTDAMIESRVGKPIPRIFAEDGEAAFRRYERELVQELASVSDTVIATGGGMGANPELLTSLKTHALTVYLWAPPEVIWQRVRHQQHRPLLQCPDPQGRIRELLSVREPVYKQADVLVSTIYRSPAEVAAHVVQEYLAAIAPQK